MFRLICVISAYVTAYYLREAKSDYDDLKATRKPNVKPEPSETTGE